MRVCQLYCLTLLFRITVCVRLQAAGLGHCPVLKRQRAKEKSLRQSKEPAGEDEQPWLANTVPVAGVSVVDFEQGGAAGVPGPVLLFRQHGGLSWAGPAQRAQEYSPQHRETGSQWK